jgi:DNA polymerase
MGSAEVLEEIAGEVRVCRLCPLWERRRNAVPGEGNPSAEIMVVGEGPGEEEDLQGRPFVGRAGRLLTEALANAGLRREDVFITNVVKCRPPGNREPTPEESKICVEKYLRRQMEAVNPRVVLLLGAVAVKTLLGIGSVTAVRGRAFTKGGRVFFCTFHPAAALYNPGNKPVFFKDVAAARELAESLRGFPRQKTLDGF